ncbi:hypothetical protein ABRP92_05565 [Pectobacterium aroidearum]|uniref:hypothetical protein n=1 Tax=Pectobacterium aroidearum TaxID=1201031 RepID=UPI0032EB43D5
MNRQTLEVMTCVESASAINKQVRAVLTLWMDGMNEERDEHEICCVSAVMTLVAEAIRQLEKATEVRNAPASTK